MKPENLWGDIPKTGSLRTPAVILREQAGVLGEKTNNVLHGEVHTYSDPMGQIRSVFNIVAPALDNYQLAILRVTHDITSYPLKVINLLENNTYDCESEEEFTNVLRGILSSPRTHQAIDSLLSQSQAA